MENYFKKDKEVGVLILAAGASRRMGKPKQLLKVNELTLIEKVVSHATEVAGKNSLLVIGAHAQKILQNTGIDKKIDYVINTEWSKGMGTSVSIGVSELLKMNPDLRAIIISVCDQPYLNTNIFNQLIVTHLETKAEIVAAKYQSILGVPALFAASLFTKLMKLEKDEGARKIIKRFPGKMASIDFEQGSIDLDTPEAYQVFLETQ